MKQFVPLSDDQALAALAAGIELVPYRVGVPCHRAFDEAAAPRPEAPSELAVQLPSAPVTATARAGGWRHSA